MFRTESSTPEREEEIYKILIFCIENDIKLGNKTELENLLKEYNE